MDFLTIKQAWNRGINPQFSDLSYKFFPDELNFYSPLEIKRLDFLRFEGFEIAWGNFLYKDNPHFEKRIEGFPPPR